MRKQYCVWMERDLFILGDPHSAATAHFSWQCRIRYFEYSQYPFGDVSNIWLILPKVVHSYKLKQICAQ